MKRILACLFTAVCLLALASCGGGAETSAQAQSKADAQKEAVLNQVSTLLRMDRVDLDSVSVISTYTSKDGKLTYSKLSFSDDSFSTKMQERPEWFSAPLTEPLAALAYGTKTDKGTVGPYLVDAEGKPLIPQDINDSGYYFFWNNDPDVEDPMNEEVVLKDEPLDVTLAVYDLYDDLLFVTTLKQ